MSAASVRTYRLASWNVNGIRAVHKKGFPEWLESSGLDIVCLQETKISSDQLTLMLTQPAGGYKTYWCHAERKGYSGVAIFTKEEPISVTQGLGIERFDAEGRTIIAEYPDFVLYNIYYPNGKRDDERLQYKMDFYHAFLGHAEAMRAQGKRIVVCGDFNTAHHPIDLARPKANEKISGFLPIERAWMDTFTASGYLDTLRLIKPDVPELYTWWDQQSRARERNVGWRIDYFFVSEELRPYVADAGILADVLGSDHCPVTLALNF
jgi:exodeoxyribonuclease-3